MKQYALRVSKDGVVKEAGTFDANTVDGIADSYVDDGYGVTIRELK